MYWLVQVQIGKQCGPCLRVYLDHGFLFPEHDRQYIARQDAQDHEDHDTCPEEGRYRYEYAAESISPHGVDLR